ncbi:retrovirus-related pol polyprotein from transposon TNT 1-94 [Tanacetum coccineum]
MAICNGFATNSYLDESIFPRIVVATSSKQAWLILKTEFQGSSKVITVKLQSHRRDFETSVMKNNESVQDYLARVSAIVSQMRSYGEKIADEVIVAKVLRSLTPKFNHVVAAIEESKDLSKFSFDELMGSLQALEARITRSVVFEEEKAFQTKGESQFTSQRARGRGRGGFRGRGPSRNSSRYCSICQKPRHTADFCLSKTGKAKFVEDTDEQVDYLFMAKGEMGEVTKEAWYIESGCSHHMTGDKTKFKELDETVKSIVCLGDDKQLKIEGRGTVSVTPGKQAKHIKDVHFAPNLAHILLSVGQLMESGHSILFDDGKCIVRNKSIDKVIACAHMSSNRIKNQKRLITLNVLRHSLQHLLYSPATNPRYPGRLVAGDMFPGRHVTRDKWNGIARMGYLPGRHRRANIVSVKQLSATVEGIPGRHVARDTKIN